MMLFKKDPHDPKLVQCQVDGFDYEIYMFAGQQTLQMALVLTALLMIPIMLFGKPFYILWQRCQRPPSYVDIEEEGLGADGEGSGEQHEEGFGDILIIQGLTGLV